MERLAPDIAKALSNRGLWADAGTSSDGYSSSQALFNEYLNWGLVSLYYIDRAPVGDLNRLIADNVREMQQRGFSRFPQFSQFLMGLYRDRPQGVPVADLYPQIVAWFAEENRKSVHQ